MLSVVWVWWITILYALICSLLSSQMTISTNSLPLHDVATLVDSGFTLHGNQLSHDLLNASTEFGARAGRAWHKNDSYKSIRLPLLNQILARVNVVAIPTRSHGTRTLSSTQ